MPRVVITRGFSDEPHLDFLDECRWVLKVNLDEETWLDATSLAALTFGGWATVFQPPWFAEYGFPPGGKSSRLGETMRKKKSIEPKSPFRFLRCWI